jgi:quercetin dioxygenase-like cupin family protein
MAPLKPKKIEKDWGYELWLANNEEKNYCGKILFIEKDKSTSMHYHEEKHETLHVLSGKLMVKLQGNNEKYQIQTSFVICEQGQSIEMPQEQVHKLIAHGEDLTLIEISTFHKDKDSLRLDE